MLLDVNGELDLLTMPAFEAALDALLSASPREALFDVCGAQFISVEGFAAIGRVSLTVERVTVNARDDFAEKIFRLLGYDRIGFDTDRATCGWALAAAPAGSRRVRLG